MLVPTVSVDKLLLMPLSDYHISLSHLDDNGTFTSQEFAMLPTSGGSLHYTNGESPDTVWPGIYVDWYYYTLLHAWLPCL